MAEIRQLTSLKTSVAQVGAVSHTGDKEKGQEKDLEVSVTLEHAGCH